MGRISIYSSDGQGKAPAALGRAVWLACSGKNVVVIQFLKGKAMDGAEFFRRLEPEIKVFCFEKADEDFTKLSQEQREEEVCNIKNGLAFAKKVLTTGECDLLILDEVLRLVNNHIIVAEDLKNLLGIGREAETDIIMTGTVLDDGIRALADEVITVQVGNCM